MLILAKCLQDIVFISGKPAVAGRELLRNLLGIKYDPLQGEGLEPSRLGFRFWLTSQWLRDID